ncbi:MAG: TadE/TadG family type IV pilus assembly protein [Terracidiphilus sp.]|jgi:Flp pilus assembly protein TadG
MKDRSVMISRRRRTRKGGLIARWRAIREDQGGALVELAIVMGFLLAPMLLGVIDIGSLVYDSIENTNAADAAAEYAAQYYIATATPGPSALPTLAQVTTAATNESPELQHFLKSGTTFTVTAATGCGTAAPLYTGVSGLTPPTCAGANLPYVQITAQSTVVPLVHFSVLGGSMTLSNTATIPLVK